MNKPLNPQDTILVACASRHRREVMAAMLGMGGHKPVLAQSSDEVLDRLNRETPNLIILDSQLLGQSGYSLCTYIRKNRKDCLAPVIILDSCGEPNSRRKALEAGADDWLSWPMAISEFLVKTGSLINAHHRHGELVEVERVLITLAAAVDAKDPWEVGHLDRVIDYAHRLGVAAGLAPKLLQELRYGAILHDMGKLAVPETILSKPGPLSESEWQNIRQHPVIGMKICQPLGLGEVVMDVVCHHHERFDGRGYPDGLAERQIPQVGRIVAIADAYDAMTSDRPYRAKMTPELAQEVLRSEAGRQFDPELVALFLPLVRGGKGV